MARRRIAFVLAVVMIGGPLAANVCEASCAGHAGYTQPSHHDHSIVAHVSAAQSSRLMTLPRDCSSVDAVFSESRVLTRTFATTIVVPVVQLTSSDERVLPIAEMESRHGPPAPVRSALPLRI